MLQGLSLAPWSIVVVIFSRSEEEHIERVLLCRLKNYWLTITMAKRQFDHQEVVYIEYEVSPSGVKPLVKKVEIIWRMKRPENLNNLRKFLGKENVYRQFI